LQIAERDFNSFDKGVCDPYGFIYITTNSVNGKGYIGQKKFDNGSRWKTYLGSGYHLQNAIKKYGKRNFQRNIVDIGFTEQELNDKEIEWIKLLNAVESEDFYNMIDGGNTQESLSRKNSIPIVCIDNNLVFKSIADASTWSGYVELTIKKSFEQRHSFSNESERLIFRPLSHVKKNRSLCCVCGNNFKKHDRFQKMCHRCKSKSRNTDSILIISHDFYKSQKSGIKTYGLDDEWVVNKIESQNINETTYKPKEKNKKKKHKKYVKNKRNDINIDEVIYKQKDLIINLYVDDNLSASEVVKKVNIKGLDTVKLNNKLREWNIPIRHYNNQHNNDAFINYNAVFDVKEKLIEVFTYKHEARNWINSTGLCETKNFSSSRLNSLFKTGKDYNGYVFKLISKEDYDRYIEEQNQLTHN
jgi:hypothetical protein